MRIANGLVLAIVISGCVDAVRPVAPTVAADASSVSRTASPDVDAGATVIRSSDDNDFLLLNSDRAAGYTSVIRVPSAPTVLIPCGGATPLDGASLQLVLHASGAVNGTIAGRQEHVQLYDRHAFNSALHAGGLCYAIATVSAVASGLVDFDLHDNDMFFSGVHTDAFGFSARGSVRFGGGAEARFQDEYHGVLHPDGTLSQFTSRITVR